MASRGLPPRTGFPWFGLSLLLVVVGSANTGWTQQEGQTTLGQPGYLVIEAVRDTGSVFLWQEGPGPNRYSLVWPEGTLSLPDSLHLDEFGDLDAGLVCGAALSGVGSSGYLVFQDGVYQISEPVALSDGVLELHLSGGELEVRGTQIRYRRPNLPDQKTKANYIFLAGMVVLITVLLRRARSQLRKS